MASQAISFIFTRYFILFISLNACLCAANSISINQPLFGDRTLVSKSGKFVMGFFRGAKGYYVGIWYQQTDPLWVANRDAPVKRKIASVLRIAEDGNLVLLDQSKVQVWSTNVSSIASNATVAVILDSGNLVLRDEYDTSKIFWQSCDHPTDTWFPGCYLGANEDTGEKRGLVSWKHDNDPASGFFSFEIASEHLFMKAGDSNSYQFDCPSSYFSSVTEEYVEFKHISNATMNYCTYNLFDNATLLVFRLTSKGHIEQILLDDAQRTLSDYLSCAYLWEMPDYCGPFGRCQQDGCDCLQGFSAASLKDWDSGNFSRGCVRDVPLQYGTYDEFLAMRYTKVYDVPRYSLADSEQNCKSACLNNCSCTAYSYDNSCSLWHGDLHFYGILYTKRNYILYLRLGNQGKHKQGLWNALGAILACLAITLFMIWVWRRRKLMRKIKMVDGTLVRYRYGELKQITNNFSTRLGGGGFGSVFKGKLPHSTNTVAVKKLEGLRQGDKQFRSEVSTIGVIHHVNLVRLVGFCSQGEEKMLVYEYMPNGSLDSHLFGTKTSMLLDWDVRYKIALETAKGLCYLHDECRSCIIHCDIKPENILLDASFSPKVADFGLAKNLDRNFSTVLTTLRGTLGYLAPEWIAGGTITAKADVYSYGMMLLEIVSGRRNTERLDEGQYYFPLLAVKKVMEGDVVSLLDPRLEGNANLEELDRACRVACWCIQDDEDSRLSMAQVVQILDGVLEVGMPSIPKLLHALAGNLESIAFFSNDKMELSDEEMA